MKKTISILALTLGVLGTVNTYAATYYIDYVAGSDSNSGTSKIAPWKRAPGMAGFTGSYSHSAGDRFIFKGGVTWPTACYQWKYVWSGNSSNWDYLGVDTTWFSGASFSRPLFDFERRVINGWTLGAGLLFEASNYVLIDNLEFANHGCPLPQNGIGTWGTTTICFNSCTYMTVTNSIVRDWWQPNTNGQVGTGMSSGGGIHKVNSGSNLRVTHTELHQENSGVYCGTALWNIVTVDNCHIHDTPQSIMSANIIYNNHIHHLKVPGDPAAHANVCLVYGNVDAWNNLIHDIPGVAQIFMTGVGTVPNGRFRAWNNIIYNVEQPAFALDNGNAYDAQATHYLWNNYAEGAWGTGYPINIGVRAGQALLKLVEHRNNVWVTTDAVQNGTTADPIVHSNNYTNTVAGMAALGYTSANLFQALDATKPTVNAGANLSASFTTDYSGATRSAPWDIGPHEFGSVVGGPGTLVFTLSSQSVSEEGGSVTLTVARTGGTTGAVGCNYATANGTATNGVNYTAASGTLSWADGDSTSKTFTVNITDANMVGGKTFTATISSPSGGATIGTPSTQTITITGTGTTEPPLLSGLVWDFADMAISSPMALSNNYAIQSIQTTDPSAAGKARFRFTPAVSGTYQFLLSYIAPSESENSIYFAIDSVPVEDDDCWDIPVSTTLTQDQIGKRGSGSYDNNEIPVWTTNLTSGQTYSVIVAGREKNVSMLTLEADLLETFGIVSVSSTSANGHYNSGDTNLIVVKFTEPATVTGTPLLPLDSGGSAQYVSGSGTDELVFRYIVEPGDNSSDLNCGSAISLNGGTIKNGSSTDADLTLPTSGPGSLAATSDIAIDTTAPTVSIAGPMPSVTQFGPVVFTVTYADDNWGTTSLSAQDIDVLIEGWPGVAVGTVTVSGSDPGNTRTVTLSNITLPQEAGAGTVKIRIPAATATDLAGNQSPQSAYSDPVSVRFTSQIRAGIMRVNSITRP